MTIGEKLAQLRKQHHYTQEQLADLLDVSRQAVSKWESDLSLPETFKLIQLSKLYDISLDELIHEDILVQNVSSAINTIQHNPSKFSSIIGVVYGVIWLLLSSVGILIVQEGVSSNFEFIFEAGTTQSTASIYQLLARGPIALGNFLILVVFVSIVFGLVLSLFMIANPKLNWMKKIRFALITIELIAWAGMILFLIETMTFNLVIGLIISVIYWTIVLYDIVTNRQKPRNA